MLEVKYHAYTDEFTFNIEIHDDNLIEADEAFRINVCTEFQLQDYCFGSTITIVDNDG